MSVLSYYHEQSQKGLIAEDPEQLNALSYLEKIAEQLIHEQAKRKNPLNFLRKPKLVHGLYMWGGVGVGKTFTMDCFYQSLPFKQKLRIHFHKFMQMAHQQLKIHQGKKNPLDIVAKQIAKEYIVICFDEFFVADIADAIILAKLLQALFANGVCLVATSNIPPDELYKNGLQRSLFLPAIALLKKHTTVLAISSKTDYRLRHLIHAGVFYTPLDETAQENMEKSFELLAGDSLVEYGTIEICHRKINIIKRAGDIVWFDFNEICHVPRSQRDYLAISEQYRTVFVSNIPIIPPSAKNTINLFIRMIDVFYDAKVRLVCTSETIVDKLYGEGTMKFEYARTCSRLIEMQSESYFGDKNQ